MEHSIISKTRLPRRLAAIAPLLSVIGFGNCQGGGPSRDALSQQPQELRDSFRTNRYEAIRSLSAQHTEGARDLLLEIALGLHGTEGRTWAASCYIESLEDKSEAYRLLSSDDTEVVNRGLVALSKERLSSHALAEMERLLQTDSIAVRMGTLGLLRRNDVFEQSQALQRVEMVLQSVDTLNRLRDGEEPYGRGTGWLRHLSNTDAFIVRAVHALGYSRGIDSKALASAKVSESALARECTVVARGLRGDESVREEFLRLMENSQHPGIRLSAVEGVSALAGLDDLPIIERLAASDPYSILQSPEETVDPDDAASEAGRLIYPIREYAKRARLIITRDSKSVF